LKPGTRFATTADVELRHDVSEKEFNNMALSQPGIFNVLDPEYGMQAGAGASASGNQTALQLAISACGTIQAFFDKSIPKSPDVCLT
jgi:hypothetical protein